MAFTIIKGGRVLDPETGLDAIKDIAIVDGKILEIEDDIDIHAYEHHEKIGEMDENDIIIDAEGCLVMPGLIDLHVHFRDPGFEEKETICTGARAAARGGFTSVCMMPNTKPVIDAPDTLEEVIEKAAKVTNVQVHPIAAITANQDGEYLTDFQTLFDNGAIAVSEDGKSVMNARVARQAMRLAAEVGIPVFAHCEDINLRARGVMNAGKRAKELGLYGILNEVEDIIVARDIILAKDTGAQLHLCHCSTEDSVNLIKFAKAGGLPVTAEVTPHHLTLTEDDVDGTDANFKMNPPLRTKADRDALIKGLKEGTIDCIATDHAPHTEEDKKAGFKQAPFGIVGLETAVPVIYTELVEKGVLTPLEMAEKMSYNPARIIGMDRGRIQVGADGDITIIDPDFEFEINPDSFFSKGRNTPYAGKKVKGLVKATIIDGRVIYRNDGKNESIVKMEEHPEMD